LKKVHLFIDSYSGLSCHTEGFSGVPHLDQHRAVNDTLTAFVTIITVCMSHRCYLMDRCLALTIPLLRSDLFIFGDSILIGLLWIGTDCDLIDHLGWSLSGLKWFTPPILGFDHSNINLVTSSMARID